VLGATLLSACSGGILSSGGPGGAVGEAPGGSSSGTQKPVLVSGNYASTAAGGVMSAPADDDALTVCPSSESRWRIRYNAGFPTILDTESSKTAPPDFQLTSTKRAPLLLEGSRVADLKGNYSDWYTGMSGYQVRAVLMRDNRPFKYQDATLPFNLQEKEPNADFKEVPAESGDVLRLYVYQERKTVFEDTPIGKIKKCLVVPPPGFQEPPAWADLNDGDLKAFEANPNAHYVGSLRVAGFGQNDADYVAPELPFFSMYRLRYGDQNAKILDPNPKTPASPSLVGADKKMQFLMEWDYALDPAKPNDRTWLPISQAGPQIRMIILRTEASGTKTYLTKDYTLDGWLQMGNGMGVSFSPEVAPTGDDLKAAYNVVFQDVDLKDGDHMEFYYFSKINGPKSTAKSLVFETAPPITDDKSYAAFTSDSDTSPLGTMVKEANLLRINTPPSILPLLKIKSAP